MPARGRNQFEFSLWIAHISPALHEDPTPTLMASPETISTPTLMATPASHQPPPARQLGPPPPPPLFPPPQPEPAPEDDVIHLTPSPIPTLPDDLQTRLNRVLHGVPPLEYRAVSSAQPSQPSDVGHVFQFNPDAPLLQGDFQLKPPFAKTPLLGRAAIGED